MYIYIYTVHIWVETDLQSYISLHLASFLWYIGFLFVVVGKYIPYMDPMGPKMYETLQIMGYLQYQLVNAGFLNHQQYHDH